MSSDALGPLASLAGGGIPTLNNTYGAILIGTFFGLILYGLSMHQAYRYCRLDFGDSVGMKVYVAFIMLLDTFHVILCMHMCYYYLVTHYFDPAALFTRVWSIDNLGLSAAVVIVSCQCRSTVQTLGGHCGTVLPCAAYATAQASILPSYSQFRELTWLFSIAFAFIVVSDVILTTVLIMVLRRSRSGIARTNSMLDVLIAYTISTGLLTDIFSGLSFIFPLIYLNTNSMVYIALDIVTTKLYVNSVIGTLNFRKTLATYGSDPMGLEIGLRDLSRTVHPSQASRPAANHTSRGSLPSVIEIRVMKELDRISAVENGEASKKYETGMAV
ncbi:hypothetical protein VTO73DRAFT_8584 [Trametes versicolor]